MKTNEVLGSPGKEEQLPSFGGKQSTSQVAGREEVELGLPSA